jgi:amino-acid N-acetyltransferase
MRRAGGLFLILIGAGLVGGIAFRVTRVHPDHERCGRGWRLHSALVDWLHSQGLARPWLTTAPGTRAQSFYESAGWKRTGRMQSGDLRYELAMSATVNRISLDERVAALLASSDLPIEDLGDAPHVALFGIERHGELLAMVGLELYGSRALLRSLVVASGARGRRLGELLLAHAEVQAARAGVTELFLLTTTAERYFAQHGYAAARRAAAPAAIALTRQFSELCPASSAFMVKRLAGARLAEGHEVASEH